jgi:dihydropteroate synthase
VIFTHRLGSWDLSQRARVVGILNVTPDSFFDGGRYLDLDRATERAARLAAEGADAIDVGGQSTRPGATGGPETKSGVGAAATVCVEEEWRRIGPVLEALAGRIPTPLSVDTFHAEVARRALDAGAAIVNDVSGLTADPSLADHAARAGAGLILMHAVGPPARFHDPREYGDVAEAVRDFLAERMREAERRGVSRDRIALDPGVGFSKRAEQSVEALRGIPVLASLGRPVYVGVSRKSFLGALTGGAPAERRLAAGLGATAAAYALGARIFRTHDVPETRDALRLAETLLAPQPQEARA